MGHVTLSVFALICFVGATYGIIDCSNGNEGWIGTLTNLCPNEAYCCEDGCCNLWRYLTSGWRLIIFIIVVAAVLISSISSCCKWMCRG